MGPPAAEESTPEIAHGERWVQFFFVFISAGVGPSGFVSTLRGGLAAT